jgi:nucleoside 2-deoxyribosyltransferase
VLIVTDVKLAKRLDGGDTIMSNYKVYLAGPISGLTYDNAQDWREHAAQELMTAGCEVYDPLRGKAVLVNQGGVISNGTKTSEYEDAMVSDALIYARDKHDVLNCDIMLVNLLGATEKSLGTICEVALAEDHNKIVILVMKKDGSEVHDHPFFRAMKMIWVETLEEALELIQASVIPPSKPQRSTRDYG